MKHVYRNNTGFCGVDIMPRFKCLTTKDFKNRKEVLKTKNKTQTKQVNQ